ncbi:MAG: hypothetical protein ACI9J2_001655 [Saprospiraceae bacterium]|jgi:hypothetical protein
MNIEKVVFAFFTILALTLNFGFFLGDATDAVQHSHYALFAAVIVGIISTILKIGHRTHVDAVLLATSLVANLQLVAASLIWGIVVYGMSIEMNPHYMSMIVSLSGGALLANAVSVIILLIETTMQRL